MPLDLVFGALFGAGDAANDAWVIYQSGEQAAEFPCWQAEGHGLDREGLFMEPAGDWEVASFAAGLELEEDRDGRGAGLGRAWGGGGS